MRTLSEGQARSCEEARTPRCACRCKGALHGGRRAGGEVETPREWFEQLPTDDPHYLPTPDVRQLSITDGLSGLVFRDPTTEEVDLVDELEGAICVERADGQPFSEAQRELLFGRLGARS